MKCFNIVGPVPKLDNELLICELTEGHKGDHWGCDSWWENQTQQEQRMSEGDLSNG